MENGELKKKNARLKMEITKYQQSTTNLDGKDPNPDDSAVNPNLPVPNQKPNNKPNTPNPSPDKPSSDEDPTPLTKLLEKTMGRSHVNSSIEIENLSKTVRNLRSQLAAVRAKQAKNELAISLPPLPVLRRRKLQSASLSLQNSSLSINQNQQYKNKGLTEDEEKKNQ